MTIILPIFLILFLILTGLAYLGFLQMAIYLGALILLGTFIMLGFWVNEMVNVFVKGNAPYVRTSKKLIAKILKEMDFSAKGGSASGGKEGPLVYDLGCGDGRVIRALAKKNKKLRIIG